ISRARNSKRHRRRPASNGPSCGWSGNVLVALKCRLVDAHVARHASPWTSRSLSVTNELYGCLGPRCLGALITSDGDDEQITCGRVNFSPKSLPKEVSLGIQRKISMGAHCRATCTLATDRKS